MRERWLLRAIPGRSHTVVVWVDREGRVSFELRDLPYSLYLFTSNEERLNSLKDSIEGMDTIDETRLEEWLAPPWYDRKVKVLRVSSRCLSSLRKIGEEISQRRIAHVINVQPGSLQLALKESGLRPCSWLGDEENDITHEIPRLKVLYLARTNGKVEALLTHIENGDVLSEAVATDFDVIMKTAKECHIIYDAADILSSKMAGWRPLVRPGANPVNSLQGLIELCRLSYMDLEQASKSSIGEILTTIEALNAIDRKMIVPRVRPGRDSWRDIDEVLEADRGGLIGSPRPGLYLWVAQLDFSSLYPSIIWRYNISPETVNRPGCKSPTRPLGSPHEVCLDAPGLVSTVLKTLVERREAIRHSGSPFSEHREKAIKWILVASFGYLGYRNSRFGNLHAYETVTWVSREVMKRAVSIASEMGYDVVHFIVDSMFVSRGGRYIDRNEIEGLAKSVSDSLGFKIKIERLYKWLIIPEALSLKYIRGASNRYYGLTLDNELIIKGSICPWEKAELVSQEKEESLRSFLLYHQRPRKLCEDLLSNSEALGLALRS